MGVCGWFFRCSSDIYTEHGSIPNYTWIPHEDYSGGMPRSEFTGRWGFTTPSGIAKSIHRTFEPLHHAGTTLQEVQSATGGTCAAVSVVAISNSSTVETASNVKIGGMIFVANAGRSGSKYLAALWSTVEDTVAVHEEPPTMDVGCGGTMGVPLEATYATRLLKVAAIEKRVEDAAAQRAVRFYAESNPNFKNSFADVVLNEFTHINITVIVLQRYVPSIVHSLLEIGWMKSKSAGGRGASSFDWMPTTASVNSFAHSHVAQGEHSAKG